MAREDDRPDEDPSGERGLEHSFDVLMGSNRALAEAIHQQTQQMQTWIQMQTRYAGAGEGHAEGMGQAAMAMQYQPRMPEAMLRELTRRGQIPHDPTAGMTKITGTGALTSLQSAQAFAAQWLGQRIARTQVPERIATGTGLGRRLAQRWNPLDTEQRKAFELYPEQEEPEITVIPAAPSGDRRPLAETISTMPGGPTAPPPPPTRREEDAARVNEDIRATLRKMAKTEEAEERDTATLVEEERGKAGPGQPERLPMLRAGGPRPSGFDTTPAGPGGASSPSAAPQPGSGAPGPPGGPPSGGGTGGGGGPGGGPPVGGGGGGGGTGGPGGGPPTMAQQFGARVAMTGGTGAGIIGMLKRIPGVGLAIDLAEKGRDIYTEQREAGRVYQEMEGGSNLAAQTERLHELAYQASMFGRMDEGAVAQMFGGVTALGFGRRYGNQANDPQNRQSALNFLYHQYNATGMNVDQGLAILQTATQNATINLSNVSDELTHLSDAAGKAGVNAKEARDSFNQYFQAAIQTGAGPSAPALAGAVAQQQAQYGPAFAQAGLGGQLSVQQQYVMAGRYGLGVGQVQAIERQAPQEYKRMLAGSVMQIIENNLPGISNHLTELRQMIAAAGGGQRVTSDRTITQQVANQFLDQFQMSENINLDTTAMIINAITNQKLDENTVMPYIVEQVAGGSLAAMGTPGAGGSPTQGSTRGGGGAAVPAGRTGGAQTGKYGLATPTPGTGIVGHLAQSALSTIGLGGLYHTHPGRSWQQTLLSGAIPNVAKTYLAQEQKTGKRSPVLEAILQNAQPGTKVAVRTSAGTRVMDINEAIKYYPAEIEAGQVDFYNDQGQNISSSTLTGGLTDPGAAGTARSEQASKGAGAHMGDPLSVWQRHHPAAAAASGGGTGGVVVDLTSEAKQLLKLLPGNSDNAAASATPPASPYVSQASR